METAFEEIVEPGRYEVVFNVPIKVSINVASRTPMIDALIESAANKLKMRISNCSGLKIDTVSNNWMHGELFGREGEV